MMWKWPHALEEQKQSRHREQNMLRYNTMNERRGGRSLNVPLNIVILLKHVHRMSDI